MLDEFGDLLHGLGKVANIEHKIASDPKVQPVIQVEAVNNELDKKLEADIIEEIKSFPWVPNLLVEPKTSRDIRLWCDLR